MKGTEKYWPYVKNGRFGGMYIEKGTHARGNTLRLSLIPTGAVETKPNVGGHLFFDMDLVEVFGIISGQPGWTEEYGWIHEGPWIEDFEKLVESGRMEAEYKARLQKVACELAEQERREYRDAVLRNYVSQEVNRE